MKKLIKLYPELKKEILDFESYFNDLKKFIKILPHKKPIYDKKQDIPSYLRHFINIIQLRLITQVSLIRKGLIAQNTETYSVLRAAMETVAAMAYVADKVPQEYKLGNFEKAWEVTTKAFMGMRTKSVSFEENEEVEDGITKSVNVMTYVEKTTKLISKALKKKNSNYFMAQYERISEYTHPNYSALEMYWKLEDDKVVYPKPEKNLTSENLGIILHQLLTLIPIYLLFLKRAYKFQQELENN